MFERNKNIKVINFTENPARGGIPASDSKREKIVKYIIGKFA